MQRLDSVVFRSKEDILTYIKEAYMEDYTYNKYSFYYKKKINWNERKWRNMLSWTFLSEYFGMDFKKQSLVVFFEKAVFPRQPECQFIIFPVVDGTAVHKRHHRPLP